MSDEADNADELFVIKGNGGAGAVHRLAPRLTVGDVNRLHDRIADLEAQLRELSETLVHD